MTKRYTTGMAQIEPRFILWRKVRFPLAVGIVAILLIISGLLLRSFLVARGIRNDLVEATELAAADTVQSHNEAAALLDGLRDDYPDHEEVRIRYAWQQVLLALRFGSSEARLASAQQALSRTSGLESTPLLVAATAGMALAQGNVDDALQVVGEEPGCREGLYVRAIASANQGQTDRAVALLDQARQGVPTFVPALSEMVLLLRQRGRFEEAESALNVLRQISPQHEDASIQSVLLSLDRYADSAELAKLVPTLAKSLGGLSVDEDHPRTLAFKNFAAGRIALLQGKVGDAEPALTEAAKILKTDQSVATWLAIARHRAGHHDAALKALSAFPDAASTNRTLLETRLDILLDLHRTVDAQKTFKVLSQSGAANIALSQGRLLFSEGEFGGAVAPLRSALKSGSHEAGLALAEALVFIGKAEQARVVLRGIKGSTPESACAKGYLAFIDAKTKQANVEFLNASKAGGRCGAFLAGRLLASSGGSQGQVAPLVKALAEREDLRDRVSLARLKFRLEGHAAALAELEKVRSLRPQGALVQSELALAYHELDLDGEARTVAKEGAKASKGHPLIVAVAAKLARLGGKVAEADRLLREGLKARPKSLELRIERAELLSRRNRFADAESAAEDALNPGAHYGQAACLRAEIQLRRGERETAQVDLNRAIMPARRHSGASVEVAIRKCLVDFHLRRGPAALGRAKTAFFFLGQVPFQDAGIEYLAGQIAERENRPNEATERYKAGLELDPSHRETWNRLRKLGSLTAEDQQRFKKIWPQKGRGGP